MWTRARFNDEYVPGLFAVAIDAYVTERNKSMWKDLCMVKTSKKKKEENSERSGLGLPQLKGEGAGITYDTQIGGVKQSWIHDVFALGLRITEEAIDDNLYELNGGGGGEEMPEVMRDLGVSMEENLETKMARFMVNGTATTYHTTRNSKALFATDHPRLDGTTFSNLTTNADLTYTVFWSVLASAENQLDHRSNRVKKNVKSLWLPPQMERQASEIILSPDRPDTANRAINAYAKSGRKISLKVWPYLTDTDAWYLQLDGDGVIFFWRRKTRFARERDFQTGDLQIKADQRWSAEINDPRCFFGNVPA